MSADGLVPEEFREDFENEFDDLDIICQKMADDINYLLDITFVEYKRGQVGAFVSRNFYCGSKISKFSKPDILDNSNDITYYLADEFNAHIQRKLKE